VSVRVRANVNYTFGIVIDARLSKCRAVYRCLITGVSVIA
jgi:hypothetical protein